MKEKRMSKKGMRNMVAWAIKWAFHPEDDEVGVWVQRPGGSGAGNPFTREELVGEMEKTWPGLRAILVRDNEVECRLNNKQMFSIKITMPRREK